jgi:hypothetical protein
MITSSNSLYRDLAQQWESFDIGHELTTRGLEKFVADYRKSLADTAVAG